MLFVRIHGATMSVEKKSIFYCSGFELKILQELNIKAVHNLKAKSLGIILTPWAMFVPISAFLFLVSKVECVHFGVFQAISPIFCQFFHN